jgi:hypothetical protein
VKPLKGGRVGRKTHSKNLDRPLLLPPPKRVIKPPKLKNF